MREIRHLNADIAGVQIEKRDDGTSRIVGYGSVFYDGTERTEFELWEGMRERIMPGAFDRALRDGDDVRGLFNHDTNHVLGRTKSGTMRLLADRRGLRYEITPPDTQSARDLVTLIQRGDVTGSSFSFMVSGENFVTEKRGGASVKIREITNIEPLYDVGPVTFPAYEATEASVRELRDAIDARANGGRTAGEIARADDLDFRKRRLRLAEAG